MRPNRASEVCTSSPVDSSDGVGKSIRVCSWVKATTVPIVIAFQPWAKLSPANR